MPICKFFLKGNCKYGDKCYNEHPRHSGPRNARHDQYDNEWRDNSWGGSKPRQHNDQRYQSPMTQRNDQWRDGYSTRDSRSDSRNQGRQQNYHHTYQESSTPNRQYGYSNSRTSNDQYHWSKSQKPVSDNRFKNLYDESSQEIDEVVQTVKSDIKTWAGSSMWPFSCYSYAKGHACIDGLPDVSPEEMRVVFLLHQPQYLNIWSELEINYCKRKDELFEMSDSERQALIAQMQVTESNPSEHLKVSLLYGSQYDFKKGPISPSTSSTNSSTIKLPEPNPITLPDSNTNKPSTASQNLPATTFSIFGSSSGFGNKNLSDASDIYTHFDDVNAHEKASFEGEKFVLGKIPTRPPPTQYCI